MQTCDYEQPNIVRQQQFLKWKNSLLNSTIFEKMTSKNLHIKTAWHIIVTGLFFAFIYTNGVYDFIMIQSQDMEYYHEKGFSEDVLVYFTDYPTPFLILWATHVLTGLLASLLLLLQHRWAITFSFISGLMTLTQTPLSFLFKDRWQAFGPFISLFDIAIMFLTLFFFLYCKKIKSHLH